MRFSVPESHDQHTLDIAPPCPSASCRGTRLPQSKTQLPQALVVLPSSFNTCLGALACRSVEAFLEWRSRRRVWRGTGLKWECVCAFAEIVQSVRGS